MKNILSLLIFFTLSSSLAFSQIEKPKPAGTTPNPKAATGTSQAATVEITWTGSYSAIIHIGSKKITLENGKTGTLTVTHSEAHKIQVEKPDALFSYAEFVIFEKGKTYLEVYLHNGVVSISKETEAQRQLKIAEQKAKSAKEKKIDSLTIIAYKRSLEEVHASHILVQCDEKASPLDTQIAWLKTAILLNIVKGRPTNKLVNDYEVKLRLKFNSPNNSNEDTLKILLEPLRRLELKYNGSPAPFEEVAYTNSEDASTKVNKGDLGFFTVFTMVYDFENRAYNTPVGQIGEIVRTRFGYHILKVIERRPSRGELLVAHIMVKTPIGMTAADSIKAKEKIESIYLRIKAGEDFATLAQQFSDDKQSAVNGGQLPWFGTSKMPVEFEESAFDLQENGDYSSPCKTQWGWHIIKRLDKNLPPPFEIARAGLREKVIKSWINN